MGGIYLGSDGNDLSLFQVGTPVEVLVFDAKDEAREAIRAAASVVRREKDGIALSWKTDPSLNARLNAMIAAIQPSDE